MKYRGKIRNRGAAQRDGDDGDEVKEATCCGLRWKPLLFLMLFIGPAVLGAIVTGSGWIMAVTGLQMPEILQARPPENDHRTRLLAFYKTHNPSKMGEVDSLLARYKGKEQKLFRKLEGKYKARI